MANRTVSHSFSDRNGAHSLLVRIARRVMASFKTIRLRQKMEHLKFSDISSSMLSDDLKQKFSSALRAKEQFQAAMPTSPGMDMDVDIADSLQRRARSAVFAVKGLLKAVEPAESDAPLRDAIEKLSAHGFVPSDELSFEANSWAWSMHEAISRLFDMAVSS